MNLNAVKRRRLRALALALLITATLLLSSVLIVSHLNHEHDRIGLNGGCAVCLQIQKAEILLIQISCLGALIVISFAFVKKVIKIEGITADFRRYIKPNSLIALKARLDN